MELIRLADIPEALWKDVARFISDFLVGFVTFNTAERNASIGGSGTLVRIGGARGILTAGHVLASVRQQKRIGLVLGTRRDEFLHRYELDTETLRSLQLGDGGGGACGPDLGVLVLPEIDASTLETRNAFYNLDIHAEEALTSPWELDHGAWFMSGFAEEFTMDLPRERDFDRVKGFRSSCCIGSGQSYRRTEQDLDYVDFEPAGGGAWGLPRHFGGFSGAGLWQVQIEQTADGSLLPKERLLSGVAFYQSDQAVSGRSITCHGRRSIYSAGVRLVRDASKSSLQPTAAGGG